LQNPEWTTREVELLDRGTTFVRVSRGAPGAPTLFLLHGLGATGLLNWRSSLDVLARRHRVVVIDHRGHGRGIRTRSPFRLVDCADDAASVADELGIDRFVAVGYSMGGPIAQLLWQRHRERVDGLVLCATACRFSSNDLRRMSFAVSPLVNAMGRLAPRRLIQRASHSWLSGAIDDPAIRERILSEVGSSDPVAIGQAASAVLRFDSRSWIEGVDVPVSVVVTERDELVRPASQRAMADRIPDAVVHPIAGSHSACATAPGLFVPTLEAACASVLSRVHARRGP
jgi:3-oxoadipate enol-lactonase